MLQALAYQRVLRQVRGFEQILYSIHLYGVFHSVRQSEAFPVREIQRFSNLLF